MHQSTTDFERDEHRQSAEFDRLLAEIGQWVERSPHWPPFGQAAALWARIEPRLRQLQSRLDRVLVVGVVGGTGVGKSTLVNALVGQCVSPASDAQRPTTIRPVVICHPDVDPAFLGFAGHGTSGENKSGSRDAELQCDFCRVDSPLLSAMILIDCPDPDTQASGDRASVEEAVNRNRDLLRRVLPQCDVMLFVATAQKYKTASVAEEVLAHAPGRQVVFVQTHAAREHDIRADWRRLLESEGFVVPHMFYIDSQDSIDRQQRGEPASEQLHELRDFLRSELAARARHRIRRSNALDLVGWWLGQVREESQELLPALVALEEKIAAEEAKLAENVRQQLLARLRGNRQLWRASLLEQATQRWGGGPFAAFVRLLNRPIKPWRWMSPLRGTVSSPTTATEAADWASAEEIGISEADLAEARSVLQQQADRAGLETSTAANRARPDETSVAIVPLVRQLSQRATAAVEQMLQRRAAKYAGPIFHGLLELLFLALLALLVGRLGYNFFYEHTWLGKPLFGLDYLVYAVLWLFVWGWLLRWLLAARLHRGLNREIAKLAESLNCAEIIGLLFADTRQAATEIRRHLAALEPIATLKNSLAAKTNEDANKLGRLLPLGNDFSPQRREER